MDGPPPPPPPHGANPRSDTGPGDGSRYRKSTDLPEGPYDIFVIPPHSAGGGFLYLPSLQCHTNSFLAGVAVTLMGVYFYFNALPTLKTWCATVVARGGMGVFLLAFGIGIVSWAIGKAQAEGVFRQRSRSKPAASSNGSTSRGPPPGPPPGAPPPGGHGPPPPPPPPPGGHGPPPPGGAGPGPGAGGGSYQNYGGHYAGAGFPPPPNPGAGFPGGGGPYPGAGGPYPGAGPQYPGGHQYNRNSYPGSRQSYGSYDSPPSPEPHRRDTRRSESPGPPPRREAPRSRSPPPPPPPNHEPRRHETPKPQFMPKQPEPEPKREPEPEPEQIPEPPKPEPPKSELPKKEEPAPEEPKPAPPKPEPPAPEPPKKEAPKPEEPKPEEPKPEPPKPVPPKPELPKQPEVKPEPPKPAESTPEPEPLKPESVKAESVKAEPVKVEPVKVEPVKAEPVKPEPPKPAEPAPQPEPPKPETPKEVPTVDPKMSEWEKAREDTRRREELKRKMDEIKRKRAEAERKKKEEEEKKAREEQEKRDKENREREYRLWKEKRAKEKAAKEAAEREAKAAQEAAEKEAAEKAAKEKARQEAAARYAAAKEAAAARRAAAAASAASSAAPSAAPSVAPSVSSTTKLSSTTKTSPVKPKSQTALLERRSPSPEKRPTPKPTQGRPPFASVKTATTDAEDDAYSFRPYDRPRSNISRPSQPASVISESTYAPSQSTANTTPPPSQRGPYSTKNPDKIVIHGVYTFNNAFMKTPIAQLVSGVGSVTDGLILRMTTEGMFVDDDVRGVAQREWDIKAWTMKLVEVWCPLHSANHPARPSNGKLNPFRFGNLHSSSKQPSSEDSDAFVTGILHTCKDQCRFGASSAADSSSSVYHSAGSGINQDILQTAEARGLHIIRTSIRDQEGKRFIFVLDESEAWKVALGLKRLRKGSQVRALGVCGLPANEAASILGNLGY